MKRLIFVLYLCVAVNTVDLFDDFTDKLADALSMSKMEVQTCIDKTNVNLEDLMRMNELLIEGVDTPVTKKSALKASCLFACLLQKKELMVDTNINIEKIKEELDTNNKMHLSSANTALRNRVLDHCIDQVTNMSNECAVVLNMITCIMEQVKYYYSQKRRG